MFNGKIYYKWSIAMLNYQRVTKHVGKHWICFEGIPWGIGEYHSVAGKYAMCDPKIYIVPACSCKWLPKNCVQPQNKLISCSVVCVCLRLNISGYKRYAFRTFRFSRHGSKRFFFAEFIGSQGTQFGWISHTSKRPVASGNSYWKSHWNDYLYVWLSCE